MYIVASHSSDEESVPVPWSSARSRRPLDFRLSAFISFPSLFLFFVVISTGDHEEVVNEELRPPELCLCIRPLRIDVPLVAAELC